MKKIVVFTGAGVSADSGLATFRDSDGLWASYRIEDVCTPEALAHNRAMVIGFYNMRRRRYARPGGAVAGKVCGGVGTPAFRAGLFARLLLLHFAPVFRTGILLPDFAPVFSAGGFRFGDSRPEGCSVGAVKENRLRILPKAVSFWRRAVGRKVLKQGAPFISNP